jgi:hypothetical protein
MEDRNATPRSAPRADARAISKKLINFCKYRIANRPRSFDAWRKQLAPLVPGWHVALIAFQLGVVYFFGGINKISHEWLSAAPMDLQLGGHIVQAMCVAGEVDAACGERVRGRGRALRARVGERALRARAGERALRARVGGRALGARVVNALRAGSGGRAWTPAAG